MAEERHRDEERGKPHERATYADEAARNRDRGERRTETHEDIEVATLERHLLGDLPGGEETPETQSMGMRMVWRAIGQCIGIAARRRRAVRVVVTIVKSAIAVKSRTMSRGGVDVKSESTPERARSAVTPTRSRCLRRRWR